MKGRNNNSLRLSESPVEVDASTAWMTRLRLALFDAVNESDVREIAKGLVTRAKQGDAKATELLFKYVLGTGGSINVRNGVIVGQSVAPPEHPTSARAGTSEKVDVMRRRVANGRGVFHPEDQ